jgi:quercetin dioxygenase-like cupin family protein
MQKLSLDALARTSLAEAGTAASGRAARTVVGGHEHALRQTVIALACGRELAEHESPGEATLLVLHGRVRLVAGEDTWDGRRGDLLVIPAVPHRLEAVQDAAVLLTVVKGHRSAPRSDAAHSPRAVPPQ